MTREQAIAEMRRIYPGSYGDDDERAFQDWLAMSFAYPAPPDRATVAVVLREVLAAIASIPSNDYSTDGDAEELIRRDLAMAAIVKAMKKLNIPITDTHTCPPSP